MTNVEFNQNSFGQQLIITGLAHLVENEGLTPHESFELLEHIKRSTYFALVDLKKEAQQNKN